MARKLSGVSACLALVVSILITIPLAALHGVVLAKAWEWFIAPTFHITNLSVVQAIGLSWIVSYVTAKREIGEKVELDAWERLVAESVFSLIISVTFFLLFWGLTLFN